MLIIAIIAVGCASGHYEENPEATLDIKQVMRSGVGGSAALFAGEDGYWIEADALTKERRILLDALIAKKVYHRLTPDRYRDLLDALNRKDRKKLQGVSRRLRAGGLRGHDAQPRVASARRSRLRQGNIEAEGHPLLRPQRARDPVPGRCPSDRAVRGLPGDKAPLRRRLHHRSGFGHRGVVFKRFHTYGTQEIERAWASLKRAADKAFLISIPMDGTGVRERDALGTMRTLMKEHHDGQWVHWTED